MSVLGQLEDIPLGSHVLRVENKGYEHFVKKFKLSESNNDISIKIGLMPEARYGWMVTSGNCVKGKISFTVFKEDRFESIPIERSEGIGFPLRIDKSGESIPTNFQVYLHLDDEDIERTIKFSIDRENDFIDLCELI